MGDSVAVTAEEFERQYAERSALTVEYLHSRNRRVRPCRCDSPDCQGWQILADELWPGEAVRMGLAGERESLLFAIESDPENDTPKLAYADWLDERGEWFMAEGVRAHLGRSGAVWILGGPCRRAACEGANVPQ